MLNLQLKKFPTVETEKMADLCYCVIKSSFHIALHTAFALSKLP